MFLDLTVCTYFFYSPGINFLLYLGKLNRVGPIQKYVLQYILSYIIISHGTKLYLISLVFLHTFKPFLKGPPVFHTGPGMTKPLSADPAEV